MPDKEIKPEVQTPPPGSCACVEFRDRDLIALAFELGMGEDACAFNIAKYCLRYQKKNGLQDLMKARVYLDRLIEHEEGKLTK